MYRTHAVLSLLIASDSYPKLLKLSCFTRLRNRYENSNMVGGSLVGCHQCVYLPGGLYTPRSSLAFCRTCLISSCVHKRVSVTFWTAPEATKTPEIAGAALGSTSTITNTPGPSAAVLYIETNLPPTASIRF